jgi:hypothetical protein
MDACIVQADEPASARVEDWLLGYAPDVFWEGAVRNQGNNGRRQVPNPGQQQPQYIADIPVSRTSKIRVRSMIQGE